MKTPTASPAHATAMPTPQPDWVRVPIRTYEPTEKGATVMVFLLPADDALGVAKVWLPKAHHTLAADRRAVFMPDWLLAAKGAELFTKGLTPAHGGILAVYPFTPADVERHRAYIARLKCDSLNLR